MFYACLRKELLLNLKSARYVLTFALLVASVLAATIIRTELYRQQTVDVQQAASRMSVAQHTAGTGSFTLALGAAADRAPDPLWIFAGGVENEMSRSQRFWFERWLGEHEPRVGRRALDSPGFRQGIFPDAVLLIAFLGSLFGLLLVFDSICGEREQGTLRLVLAGPVPRDTIIAAKIASGLIALSLPIIVSWVAGVAWVTAQAGITLGPDHLARLGVLMCLSLLYVSVFFGFGAAISAWTHHASTALAAAVLLWVILALVVPTIVPVVVRHIAPVPPESKMIMERRTRLRVIAREQVPQMADSVMRESGLRGWNAVWDGGLERLTRDAESATVRQLDQQYQSLLRYQTDLVQAVSRVSPVASFVACATELAGTGVGEYHRYVAAVDAFRQQCGEARSLMQQDAIRRAKGAYVDEERVRYDADLWPHFVARRPPLEQLLPRCWLDMVLLAGLVVMLFLSALLGFMRYDAR